METIPFCCRENFYKISKKKLPQWIPFQFGCKFHGKNQGCFFRKVIFTEQIRAAASVLNVSRDQVDPVNKRLKLNINKMRIWPLGIHTIRKFNLHCVFAIEYFTFHKWSIHRSSYHPQKSHRHSNKLALHLLIHPVRPWCKQCPFLLIRTVKTGDVNTAIQSIVQRYSSTTEATKTLKFNFVCIHIKRSSTRTYFAQSIKKDKAIL